MREPAGRQDLVATLEESLRRLKQLVADASDDQVPVADLVAQISAMERLDDRRDELVGRLRRAASAGLRAQRPGPTFRALVLEVLEELRWPQNARFLEEYLWARHHVQLDSRAFAPLRRDEQRAFERAPGARDAYVAPALNPDGSPNPRWLTSSAWGLERRIIASPQTERLLDMEKVYSLAGRPGSPGPRDDGGPRRPVDVLLEKYARQILGTEPPPVTATEDENATWRNRVRDHASTLIGEIRRDDEPRRKHLARELATLPEQARIWGWPQTKTTGALCHRGLAEAVPSDSPTSHAPGTVIATHHSPRRSRARVVSVLDTPPGLGSIFRRRRRDPLRRGQGARSTQRCRTGPGLAATAAVLPG